MCREATQFTVATTRRIVRNADAIRSDAMRSDEMCYERSFAIFISARCNIYIYNTDRICIPEKVVKRCMGVLCTWVKLYQDLQNLGCELYQDAFGDWALPTPAIRLPRPPSHYNGLRREGRKDRNGLGIKRGRGGGG